MNEPDITLSTPDSFWKDLFFQIFEQSIIGMAILSKSTDTFIRVNPSFATMLGYTPDEMRGMNWRQITHPDDVVRSAEFLMQHLLAPQTVQAIEKRYVTKNGDSLVCRITTSVVTIADNPYDIYRVTQIENINTVVELKKKLLQFRESLHKDVTA